MVALNQSTSSTAWDTLHLDGKPINGENGRGVPLSDLRSRRLDGNVPFHTVEFLALLSTTPAPLDLLALDLGVSVYEVRTQVFVLRQCEIALIVEDGAVRIPKPQYRYATRVAEAFLSKIPEAL